MKRQRRAPLAPALGTIEIETYSALLANENNADGRPHARTRANFWLPAVVLASGLTTAFLVEGAARLLGFNV